MNHWGFLLLDLKIIFNLSNPKFFCYDKKRLFLQKQFLLKLKDCVLTLLTDLFLDHKHFKRQEYKNLWQPFFKH